MEKQITDILRNLMACASVTHTEKETVAETWMLDFFRKQSYFQTYPERCGLFPIPGDPLHRNTVWALVKCDGEDNEEYDGKAPENGLTAEEDINAIQTAGQRPTVIFMGHHDVVPADVYGDAAPWAFDLDNIAAHLNKENLSAEAYTDLLSGEWLFGRGCCDMLGGTAVQMALLAEQAEKVLQKTDKSEKTQNEKNVMADKPVKTLRPNPDEAVVDDEDEKGLFGPGKADTCGSLLFLSVPDEESFSTGMRGSLSLLEGLEEQFNLDYRLVICAEPNQRLADGKTQVVYSGSIGKLLPVVLVQGKLVQVGSYREGVNPLGILSRVVAVTEGDETFTERYGEEVSVPPVWMYLRDLKEGYDFSLPKRAAGYCNVLTFQKTPAQVMAYFLGKIKGVLEEVSHPVTVMTWVTLWQQAGDRTEEKGTAAGGTQNISGSNPVADATHVGFSEF